MQRQNPVERKVQDLKTTLRALMIQTRDKGAKWDQYLQQALKAQRTRRNCATGETPSLALLGYEIAQPGEWEIPEFRRTRRRNLENKRERRRRIVERQLQFNEKTYPLRDQPPETTFRVGEYVMVKNYSEGPFTPPWMGPCLITQALSDRFFLVEREGKITRLHVDQIRKAPRGNIAEREPEEDDDPEDDEPEPPKDSGAQGPAGTGVDHGPPPPGQPLCRLRAIDTITDRTTTVAKRESERGARAAYTEAQEYETAGQQSGVRQPARPPRQRIAQRRKYRPVRECHRTEMNDLSAVKFRECPTKTPSARPSFIAPRCRS